MITEEMASMMRLAGIPVPSGTKPPSASPGAAARYLIEAMERGFVVKMKGVDGATILARKNPRRIGFLAEGGGMAWDAQLSDRLAESLLEDVAPEVMLEAARKALGTQAEEVDQLYRYEQSPEARDPLHEEAPAASVAPVPAATSAVRNHGFTLGDLKHLRRMLTDSILPPTPAMQEAADRFAAKVEQTLQEWTGGATLATGFGVEDLMVEGKGALHAYCLIAGAPSKCWDRLTTSLERERVVPVLHRLDEAAAELEAALTAPC